MKPEPSDTIIIQYHKKYNKKTMQKNSQRQSRWYFGGLASAGAACVTHPLDLLKVHLQTGTGVAGATAAEKGSTKPNVTLIGHVAKVRMKYNYSFLENIFLCLQN